MIIRSTFCRICEAHCPLLAELDDAGNVTRLHPDAAHPVAQGFACHKGLAFLQVHNDPDRLNFPLRRRNSRSAASGVFDPLDWDAALAEIGDRVRALQTRYGPDCVAVYLGNPVGFNSRALPLAAGFARLLGSKHAFSANTQDLANKYAASQHVFGSHAFTIPDLANTDFFLCFGGNPKVSKGAVLSLPRPMDALKDIRRRGGDILFVNPRRIESAGPDTGDVLQIKPDTDVYLMAALLHALDRAGVCDWQALAVRGARLDGLREFIADYSPARVSAVVGVPAERIEAIAAQIAAARSAAFYMSTGVNQGRQGTLAAWLLAMLSFVTGNFGRRGGNYRPPGGLDTRAARPVAPVDTVFGPMQPVWGCLPGNLLADFIGHPAQPIRALINISGNPLLTMSGEDRLRRAFAQLDLIVSIDLYRSDTGEISDYLLPASDWLERADINFLALGLQLKPFVQYTDAVVPARFARRNDQWILTRLAQAVGALPDAEAGEDWGFVEKVLAASGITLADLCKAEGQTVYLEQEPDYAATFAQVVRHADGRIDCCPTAFAPALQRCHALFVELAAAAGDRLQLISLRSNYMHNSWLANMPQLRQGRHALNALHMHPEDANRRELADGQAVTVSNRHGAIATQLQLDPSLRPGVVAMSHGYGQRLAPALTLASKLPGANPNRLLPTGPGSYEPLSGMSWMNGVEVEVAAQSSG